MDKEKKKFGIFKYILVLAVLVILSNSLVICREDEYKLVRQFGKVQRVISTSGLSFKIPLIQSTDTVPKELLLYDLPASDVISSDKIDDRGQLCTLESDGSAEIHTDTGQFYL